MFMVLFEYFVIMADHKTFLKDKFMAQSVL